MVAVRKKLISQRIVAYELAGFAAIIVLIWLDEVIDIPALLLGAPETPVNWRESLFESVIIILLCVVVIRLTNNLFQRMKYLEGLLPICASCRKIRIKNGDWQQLEAYLQEQSDARFTHGICPECAEKLYPECNPYQKA